MPSSELPSFHTFSFLAHWTFLSGTFRTLVQPDSGVKSITLYTATACCPRRPGTRTYCIIIYKHGWCTHYEYTYVCAVIIYVFHERMGTSSGCEFAFKVDALLPFFAPLLPPPPPQPWPPPPTTRAALIRRNKTHVVVVFRARNSLAYDVSCPHRTTMSTVKSSHESFVRSVREMFRAQCWSLWSLRFPGHREDNEMIFDRCTCANQIHVIRDTCHRHRI